MEKNSDLKLPYLFSDGMVLQRDKILTIWGWDQPQQPIEILFMDQRYETVTSSAGEWFLQMGPFPAGGPYHMQIIGSDREEIGDIHIGEVWLAGGQSNMELPLSRTLDLFEAEIARINNPFIREFHVPIEYDFTGPQKIGTEVASWKTANQEHVHSFSAVAYFFAEKLYQTLQVPIGIIMTAAGGTPAEAWMARSDLEHSDVVKQELAHLQRKEWIEQVQKEDRIRIENWYQQIDEKEKILKPREWLQADFDDAQWQVFTVPNMFHGTDIAGAAGAVWFRKKFHLPSHMISQEDTLLKLGAIVDYDEAYINGTLVGKTEYRYPPRNYRIPAGLLQEGENILTVRVIINGTNGGFIPGKIYGLVTSKGTINLTGTWKYKRSAEMAELAPMTFFQYKPTGLYNSMIHPIKNYSLAGFIFYQGESNTGAPHHYAELMKKLIQRWRSEWADDTLPFLFVQLANYRDDLSPHKEDDGWAILRQQQAQVEREVPNTALTISIDVGEGNDLHPQDKRTIGQRLADDALQIAYEYPINQQKPRLEKVQVDGKKLVLTFTDTGSKILSRNDSSLFEIFHDKEGWRKVDPCLKDNTMVIDVEPFGEVAAVRYAYTCNPENPPFYSENGYPVAPFVHFLSSEQSFQHKEENAHKSF